MTFGFCTRKTLWHAGFGYILIHLTGTAVWLLSRFLGTPFKPGRTVVNVSEANLHQGSELIFDPEHFTGHSFRCTQLPFLFIGLHWKSKEDQWVDDEKHMCSKYNNSSRVLTFRDKLQGAAAIAASAATNLGSNNQDTRDLETNIKVLYSSMSNLVFHHVTLPSQVPRLHAL